MQIRRAAVDAVVAHAAAEAPLECCGLLVGGPEAIQRAYPARNLRQSRTSFLVKPEDHFAAIRAARGAGLSVVGAYHSHPASEAWPSPRDIDEADDPAFIHVIVSLASAEPVLRGFLLGEKGITQIPLTELD